MHSHRHRVADAGGVNRIILMVTTMYVLSVLRPLTLAAALSVPLVLAACDDPLVSQAGPNATATGTADHSDPPFVGVYGSPRWAPGAGPGATF